MNKDTSKASISAQFSSRKFKGGAYATVISVVVIAVVIVINLIAGEFDYTVDLTSNARYSLPDSTKEYMKSVRDQIDIYYLAQDGMEFEYYDMDRFFEVFNKVSDNIRITRMDPVQNPGFAKQYTTEEIYQYSFLVVDNNTGRSQYLDPYDYLETEFNYNSFSKEVTAIDLEGQLVSAIRYVTAETIPVMYVLKGHGETPISTALAAGITKENFETRDLSLITEGEIPEDCDVLMIYQPSADLASGEINIIEKYMAQGGRVLLIADYYTPNLTNLCGLLDYYGLSLTEGFVIEGDSSHHLMSAPNEIVPDLGTHVITDRIDSSRYILLLNATGIIVNDNIRSTVTVDPILTTSSKAYAKHSLSISTLEKEEGDYEGPFYVGVEASETYNGATAQLVVYSCLYFLDDSLIKGGTYENGDVFYNTLDYLADIEVETATRPVSLIDDMVTVTEDQAITYAALYVVLFPLLMIIAGTIVVSRRRKL